MKIIIYVSDKKDNSDGLNQIKFLGGILSDLPEVVSIKETSKVLNLKPREIRGLCYQKKLTQVKYPGKRYTFVTKESLEAYKKTIIIGKVA